MLFKDVFNCIGKEIIPIFVIAVKVEIPLDCKESAIWVHASRLFEKLKAILSLSKFQTL